MRFALLGDHPDGLDLVRALTASGRHALHLYSGPPAGMLSLQSMGLAPRRAGDLEETLVDPEIDAVIVASSPLARPTHLRRALQSDCHVLCVHPAGPSPDIAYEAAMIQADTGRVLLPLLPLAFHPGCARLAEWSRNPTALTTRIVEMEIWSTEDVLLEASVEGHHPGLPGWEVMRILGGEISEVFLFSGTPDLQAAQLCLAAGRFLRGGLFQATYLPQQSETRFRVSLVTTAGRATLNFPQGWPGPSQLTYITDTGEHRAEQWDAFNPWMLLVDRFEQAVVEASVKKAQPGQLADECLTKPPARLGWLDALRSLELDDAARRSVARGRATTLEFQEAVEEAGFKGTMTLLGCSLIWLSVIVLILSAWIPWIGWLIVPVFGLFLIMQTLRWILPKPGTSKDASEK